MKNSEGIENLILSHGTRGMDVVKQVMMPGYCQRAAQLILNHKGVVLIGTGFPVHGTFETDGPIGALSLYKVLEHLGYTPVLICAPPLAEVIMPNFRTQPVPILPWDESIPVMRAALQQWQPAIIISIEQPGVAQDGRYYSMRKRDITDLSPKCDLLLHYANCPTIGIGDGGNEIGMGNALPALATLPIIPCVTPCTELVIATVSNWGAYGIIAALSQLLKHDLFALFDVKQITEDLVAHGAVDGISGKPECTEDGFPLEVGLSLIAQLRG